jgi:hypothetical protein
MIVTTNGITTSTAGMIVPRMMGIADDCPRVPSELAMLARRRPGLGVGYRRAARDGQAAGSSQYWEGIGRRQ